VNCKGDSFDAQHAFRNSKHVDESKKERLAIISTTTSNSRHLGNTFHTHKRCSGLPEERGRTSWTRSGGGVLRSSLVLERADSNKVLNEEKRTRRISTLQKQPVSCARNKTAS
jgi:hypothetical protein